MRDIYDRLGLNRPYTPEILPDPREGLVPREFIDALAGTRSTQIYDVTAAILDMLQDHDPPFSIGRYMQSQGWWSADWMPGLVELEALGLVKLLPRKRSLPLIVPTGDIWLEPAHEPAS